MTAPRDEAKRPQAPDSEAAPTREERRRTLRIRLELLVQLRFESYDAFLNEYASDLSVGGMFIRMADPVREVGRLVYLQFLLSDGSRLIEGLARIVRVHAPDSGRTPGVGVEFVNLDPESQRLIEHLVAERIARPGPGGSQG